jgi:spore maturation protein CgeB
LLTQDAPYLDQYYDADKEIAVFDGIGDLQSKVKYFLAHPEERDAIAQRGHARTAREHTYAHRFGHLLAVAAELRATKTKNGAPSIYVLNSPWFSSVVGRHHTGFTLRLLRKLLVMPFALFFGKVRGARAARRLVYEFSWRVSRSRTYSSAGLPGRMFYKES